MTTAHTKANRRTARAMGHGAAGRIENILPFTNLLYRIAEKQVTPQKPLTDKRDGRRKSLLTDDQVRAARAEYDSNPTKDEVNRLAAQYDVSRGYMARLVNGDTHGLVI